jgi:hypothetical protein
MKPTIPKRRRCDARVRYRQKKMEQFEHGLIDKDEVMAVLRRSDRCRKWAIPGSRRCELHGGLATGARTEEGKRRQAEGHRRWLERLRAEGRKPGPAKGTGGRPKLSGGLSPELKAKRRLDHAAIRLARARSVLRHAVLSSPNHRSRRWQVRQEVEREVQRLLDDYQAERRAMRMPPLSEEALEQITQSFRERMTGRLSPDGGPRLSDVSDLQDRVRDAEDALEEAKADYARVAASTRARRSMTVGDHADPLALVAQSMTRPD